MATIRYCGGMATPNSLPTNTTHTERSAPSSARTNWMLYGAYGATGRKILDEALARGHRPVLAGRDGAQLAELGRVTGLSTLILSLDEPASLVAALSRVNLVLHAAGPFSITGPVMRAACVAAGCSYLDINGEIGDFGAALADAAKAREAGVGIIPGVGYGVVFAETLAAYLAQRLPDASHVRLSLATQVEGRSRAASMSIAATVGAGGRDIFEDRLRHRPIASAQWRVPDVQAVRINFGSAPLGELLAIHRSTRIPNITTGIPLPRTAALAFRIAGPVLSKLMAWQARRVARTSEPGRPASRIEPLRSRVWAEARNADGISVAAVLETGEGYAAAAAVAVRAVELQLVARRTGVFTPVEAFGTSLALSVPATTITDLHISGSAL